MDETQERRAAENENLFRGINERVEELSRGLDELALVCECADAACAARLRGVGVAEYDDVRAHPDRFLVAPGHERPELENVIAQRPGYVVVAKRGAAGEVARAADPRAD